MLTVTFWGHLADSEGYATLDLGVVGLSPTLGVEITKKLNKLTLRNVLFRLKS